MRVDPSSHLQCEISFVENSSSIISVDLCIWEEWLPEASVMRLLVEDEVGVTGTGGSL